jgi:hypothetical protein
MLQRAREADALHAARGAGSRAAPAAPSAAMDERGVRATSGSRRRG